MADANPLLSPWTAPFAMPPFAALKPEHFSPAFTAGMEQQRREVDAIAAAGEAADFDNTVGALERSGAVLRDVSAVFFNLAGADTNDALQAVEREMAPLLARHTNAIFLDDALFRRVDAVMTGGTAGLGEEQARVLERYHTAFVRAGAGLGAEAKARLGAISERLATLGTQFGQNVLAAEKAWSMPLGDDDLAGLPDFVRDGAAKAAADRGLPGHVMTLSRSLIEPFLQYSSRRDLREKAFRAWAARGEGLEADNRPLIAEMASLRAERARLLGYETYAHYHLADSMARTPDAVRDLLLSVWAPARAKAERDAAALQDMIAREGGNFPLAAWDWRYYAERRRKAEFDLDEAALKPYLQLDRIIEAAFYTASRLFGLSFEERTDLPVYHPDVRVWDVTRDGAPVGLFLGDYFARASKRSGAWMSAYREQQRLVGDIKPIIVNVLNVAKGADGQPTLITFDDARTLFHEFGHGLHGLLSDVTYPFVSGTNVARDFVELPSQLYEHWLEQPEVLKPFAVHYRTGEPMPEDLLGRLLASRTFNQGFSTVEYLSSALVDLELHLARPDQSIDADQFEARVLSEIEMPEAIIMRHRLPHFQHVFSGDYYAAGYYSYLWSEVLDADGFGAFQEAGDVFDPATAHRLHDFIYSAGGRTTPDAAYAAFRGRPPEPSALLRKRGLAPGVAA